MLYVVHAFLWVTLNVYERFYCADVYIKPVCAAKRIKNSNSDYIIYSDSDTQCVYKKRERQRRLLQSRTAMRTLQWSVLLGLVHYTMGLGKQDHGHSNKPDPEVSDSIGCYVCTSLNGSNPSCHDDFDKAHPTSQSFYRPSCSTPKFNKNGKTIGTRLAKRCYKLKATRDCKSSLRVKLFLAWIFEASVDLKACFDEYSCNTVLMNHEDGLFRNEFFRLKLTFQGGTLGKIFEKVTKFYFRETIVVLVGVIHCWIEFRWNKFNNDDVSSVETIFPKSYQVYQGGTLGTRKIQSTVFRF